MSYSELLAADLQACRRAVYSCGPQLLDAFKVAVSVAVSTLKNGGKILAFGNGGSASDAEHLVAELVGRFGFDRAALPAIACTVPSPVMTAVANDYGFDAVFRRQVEAFAKPGDLVIGISTSGNSPNVLAAFEAARKLGAITVAMTGSKDSKLSEVSEIVIKAPSAHTPGIQEIHSVIIHSFCRAVELAMFPGRATTGPQSGKLIAPQQIDSFAAEIKGAVSVFTNGCFDVLHPGHVKLLKKARQFGDLLILGLNSDDSVKRLKGPQRPIHSFAERVSVLEALEMIDFIIGFDEDTPKQLIERVTPSILVKGGDYTRDTVVGAGWVEAHNGRVEIVELLEGHSTTRILSRNE